ncbi:hypothetical protein PRIPAC_73418 [Pristionchus pacificus]|uniref:Uncharacterized protein n=1 Tax=Pristionchus pacificus TaxID=54126 RepID=A0A454Y3A9_PRIPA|nr:hypothetical protein PRIPAC_73418 [Pristionchus pacificus]|eukprot:PDM76899.1 hypothetical protein PRIPAC_42294 [Pristionchus pacificus]
MATNPNGLFSSDGNPDRRWQNGSIAEFHFPTFQHPTNTDDNHAATAAVTKLDGTIVHGSRIRARHSKYWSHTWQTAVNDKKSRSEANSGVNVGAPFPREETVQTILAEGGTSSDAVAEWPFDFSDQLFIEDMSDWMEAARSRWMRTSNWFCSCWECSDQ